jgi:hypothetical protein
LAKRQQARSQVRRPANDDLLLSRAFAGQIADDHHTGSDANANLELGGGLCLELGHGVDQRPARVACSASSSCAWG